MSGHGVNPIFLNKGNKDWTSRTLANSHPPLSLCPITLEVCNVIKKETQAQVFSGDFCETSDKIFFTEHLDSSTDSTFSKNLGTYLFSRISWFFLIL